MNDEAHLLPEQPDEEQAPALQPGHIHPFSKRFLTETKFVRFVQKIGQVFARRSSSDHELKLSGRIQELQTRADQVYAELVIFKQKIKEKVNPELFSLVVVFLDPLMKETGRAPPISGKNENAVHQVKLFSRYVESIEKANMWVKIGKEPGTHEELEHAIIQHVAKEFLLRIDRDVQVIQDYLKCAVSEVGKSETIKRKLSNHLMPDLLLKINELSQLKVVPQDFSLQSFMQWRIYADEKRERYFSDALHLIDGFTEDFLDSEQRRKSMNPLSDEITETDF